MTTMSQVKGPGAQGQRDETLATPHRERRASEPNADTSTTRRQNIEREIRRERRAALLAISRIRLRK